MASPTGAAGPSQSSPKPAKEPSGNPELPIKKIGKYEIQKKIGAGGMGAVYLAMDSTLRRTCALKVLPQEKAGNPTLVKRFKAEARSAANLRHDNIVAIYETGEADGYLYIALEYVEGTDVANLVHKRGMIPLKRSVEMVRQVANALEHAVQQGIVHRDIKPGNLLVRRDGVVKLADLGLARSLDEDVDTSITRAGTTVGTVDYMAPEQARDSKAADVRSDIYSLGCTWYYMLTGEPPFPEGSLTNKLRSHAETPMPDPRLLNPAVSEAVYGVLSRMTEKKPSQRYQTPKELLDDLEAASLNGDLVSDAILSDMPADDGLDADTVKARHTETVEYGDDEGPPDFEEFDKSSRPGKKSKASKRESADKDAGPAFKPPPGKDRD
jgi:serine/threonine-protein kinase